MDPNPPLSDPATQRILLEISRTPARGTWAVTVGRDRGPWNQDRGPWHASFRDTKYLSRYSVTLIPFLTLPPGHPTLTEQIVHTAAVPTQNTFQSRFTAYN